MSLQVREEALPHPGALLLVPPEGTRPVGSRGSPRNRWNLREALGGRWEEPGAQWGWGKGARGGRPHVQGGMAQRLVGLEPLGRQDARALGVWTWTGGCTC